MTEAKNVWWPYAEIAKETNLAKLIREAGFAWQEYQKFHRWTNEHHRDYLRLMLGPKGLNLFELCATEPTTMVDLSAGFEQPQWLPGATLNVADLALRGPDDAVAIIAQDLDGKTHRTSRKTLREHVNRIAGGLAKHGVQKGDRVAVALPMSVDAVAFYIAVLKMGGSVVGLIDTDPAEKIAEKLEIAKPRLIFTQDTDRHYPLYPKLVEAAQFAKLEAVPIVAAMQGGASEIVLEPGDMMLDQFMVQSSQFESVKRGVNEEAAIYFSSGSTGTPKAIMWSQAQFINLAKEGFEIQDNRPGDVAFGASRLGWMMGPHQIFSALPNGATMAFSSLGGASKQVADFMEEIGVTTIMAVPAHFRHWRDHGYMQRAWHGLRSVHYTGEAASPELAEFVMQMKPGLVPLCPYCGGTELAGAYGVGVPVLAVHPAQFNGFIPGIDVQLYDEDGKKVKDGEVGSVVFFGPGMGWSTTLLNKNHHQEYYADSPVDGGRVHGDLLQQMPTGGYIHRGRSDGLGNPNGVKTSPTEIESLVNEHFRDEIDEAAAIFVQPPEAGGTEHMVLLVGVGDRMVDPDHLQKQLDELVKKEHSPYVRVYDLVVLPALPRNAANKLLHKQMKTDYCHQKWP